jgi:ThiF family
MVHEMSDQLVSTASGDSGILRIDDDDRYSRLRLISWWRQERLAAAKVLVVGAGALGNEVLKNLALLGVGTIHLIDLDEIEPSNLAHRRTRQDRGFGITGRAMFIDPELDRVRHEITLMVVEQVIGG